MSEPRNRYGRVSSVFTDPDRNDVYVNVVTGPNREPRGMKFSTFQKGAWSVPEEGDMVEVHSINGQRVARWPTNPPQFAIPSDLSEGDFCFKFNETTELHFSKQTDGTFNIKIEADGDVSVVTQNGGNVSIQSDGSVSVDGSDITLGSEAAEALAKQAHTHNVTLSDGSNAQTGQPNEDGTQNTSAE